MVGEDEGIGNDEGAGTPVMNGVEVDVLPPVLGPSEPVAVDEASGSEDEVCPIASVLSMAVLKEELGTIALGEVDDRLTRVVRLDGPLEHPV